MSPREETPLLEHNGEKKLPDEKQQKLHLEAWGYDDTELSYPPRFLCTWAKNDLKSAWFLAIVACVAGTGMLLHSLPQRNHNVFQATGPYTLVERQVGESFFDYYNFFNGPDSVGSAGHQVYVSKDRAAEIDIFSVDKDVVYMKSAPTKKGPRESIRLEGKRRFNRGLFVLDLDHMPAGAGVWPAFWMTDEAHWPDNGEIDIVENINNQTQAKTALHTSGQCRMYGQVPEHAKTGTWDRSTGIPDPSTNASNHVTNIEADDCWNLAAHRWYNQGCVLIDDQKGSIGKPVNDRGGGVYVLEWDPVNGYIKSWTFSRNTLPSNLERAMKTSGGKNEEIPNPNQWGLPYAYFAIGAGTDCSADHFQNMRLVFNLAFCGEVAGNRFFKDCHEESQAFNVSNDPVKSCNAYIESNPGALDEAYWKIRGVYAWERELQLLDHHHAPSAAK